MVSVVFVFWKLKNKHCSCLAPFWSTSDVTCPNYCGLLASQQTRTVQCKGTINNVVVVIADSYCDAASKPSTTVPCAATAPCSPFWFSSDVTCPTYCGLAASTVQRTVSCKGTIDNQVIVIADSYCDAASKPSTSVDCSATAPCGTKRKFLFLRYVCTPSQNNMHTVKQILISR
jgi:hypothetical protein